MDKYQGRADIKKLYESGMYEEAIKYLGFYIQVYGVDEDLIEIQEQLRIAFMPEVLVIALDCAKAYIDEFTSKIKYINLKILCLTLDEDILQNVLDVITHCKSEYICFLEKDKISHPDKIVKMVDYLNKNSLPDSVVCLSDRICFEGENISGQNFRLSNIFKGKVYKGTDFLKFEILENEVLFGGLSCYMFRKKIFEAKQMLSPLLSYKKQESKLVLLFECIYGMVVGCMNEALVSRIAMKIDSPILKNQVEICRSVVNKVSHLECYRGSINSKDIEILPNVYSKYVDIPLKYELPKKETKKEIMFFCTDIGEKYNLMPIAEEAVRRGYKIEYANDLDKTCEIGFYCQHFGSPQNAKFSVVLLHDMAQGHNRWPDIWNLENWDYYDVGIVPGNEWAERWAKCASRHYANPRYGVYNLGYPKGDYANSLDLPQRADEIKEKLQLKYERTILYAPSWEYNEKEDDFVQAFQSMKVNLLIKQADWPSDFSYIMDNEKNMRMLHEGKYENVYYIESQENILVALEICDLIVSDESSVMTEGLLFGKPSIAVSDWLIPDCDPPRFAEIPSDNVYKCTICQLRKTGEEVLKRIENGTEPMKHNTFFSNIGNCCKDIMDMVDYFRGDINGTEFKDKEVVPEYMPECYWN